MKNSIELTGKLETLQASLQTAEAELRSKGDYTPETVALVRSLGFVPNPTEHRQPEGEVLPLPEVLAINLEYVFVMMGESLSHQNSLAADQSRQNSVKSYARSFYELLQSNREKFLGLFLDMGFTHITPQITQEANAWVSGVKDRSKIEALKQQISLTAEELVKAQEKEKEKAKDDKTDETQKKPKKSKKKDDTPKNEDPETDVI